MTTHILFPQLEREKVPATMSPAILQGVLRDELGFDGVVVTDGMHMLAIKDHYGVARGCVMAIKAGADLLCIGTGGSGVQESQRECLEALYEAALSGELPMERIDNAVSRILRAKAKFGGPAADTAPDFTAHAELNRTVCARAVTMLCGKPVTGKILYASAPVKELAFGLTHADPRKLTFGQMASMYTGGEHTTLDQVDYTADFDSLIIGVQAIKPDSIELEAARQALAAGKQVAFVLLAAPYGAPYIPEGCTVVCVYTLTPDAVAAAIDTLLGKAGASGKLPVKLPVI